MNSSSLSTATFFSLTISFYCCPPSGQVCLAVTNDFLFHFLSRQQGGSEEMEMEDESAVTSRPDQTEG